MMKTSTLDIVKHKDPIFIVVHQLIHIIILSLAIQKRSQCINYEKERKKLITMIEKEHEQAWEWKEEWRRRAKEKSKLCAETDSLYQYFLTLKSLIQSERSFLTHLPIQNLIVWYWWFFRGNFKKQTHKRREKDLL